MTFLPRRVAIPLHLIFWVILAFLLILAIVLGSKLLYSVIAEKTN